MRSNKSKTIYLFGVLGTTAILFSFLTPGLFGTGTWAAPTDEATPVDDNPCIEEAPNGIQIANCFANPTADPEPEGTPIPTPEVIGEDDDTGLPTNNPSGSNSNPAEGSTVDITPSAGGCSLFIR